MGISLGVDGSERRCQTWWPRQCYGAERALRAAYALMALLLVGYLASLIVRGPGRSSELLDG
jgi:hypothetical protein